MKYVIAIILLTTVITLAYPDKETRIKIAVIDTGIDIGIGQTHKTLCKTGHKSFTGENPLTDVTRLKHGTNVAGLIADGLDNKKYCILVLKISEGKEGDMDFKAPTKAVEYAIKQNVKFINLSIAAPGYVQSEYKVLNKAVNLGIVVSVAAGNDFKDFDIQCNIYPACYKIPHNNYRVVGSSTYSKKEYSNYGGPINFVEDGTDVGSPRLTGTSQATAIHTNKLIRSL